MTTINKIRAFIQEKPHSLILLYFIFYLTGFFALERIVSEPKYIIYCKLDDLIPFCEWFLIPYASWFILLVGAPVYFLFTDKRDFLKLCGIMFNGMTFCLLCYLLFPNGLQLRPEVTGDNFLCTIAKLLYTIDTPTNVCPSIHVASTAAVCLVVWRAKQFQGRPVIKAVMLLWSTLIILSTVFLKQHSVIDVVCGILLSLVLYWIAYSPWMEKHSPFREKL